jgi:hypothetical protein
VSVTGAVEDGDAFVREALSRLSQREQRLLELLAADPLASYAEISSQLGIPVGSIGPARARALRRLSDQLSMPMYPLPGDWATPLAERGTLRGHRVRGHWRGGRWVRPYRVGPARKVVLSPRSLTRAAVFLAGKKRSAVRDEWRSHLFGWPGQGLTSGQQIRAARGFLWAAVLYRLEDAADLAWRPADAVLGSRTLSNLFVWGPVILTLVAIVQHDGRFGLVADDQDPVALGAFLYVVIKTGRWWRQIKLPEPKPRQAKE